MLSRRDLISAGVAGSCAGLSAGTDSATEVEAAQPQADREGQREIARRIQSIETVLERAYLSPSLAHGLITNLRAAMEQFLRANAKFPEFIEIGVAVFFDVYDWHVKHGHPLAITRLADGRYALQFMFTSLILRPEQDRNYIGMPFERL
jgi:hypothetical protein